MGLFSRKEKTIENRSDIIVPNADNVLVQAFLGTDAMDKTKALNIPSVKGCIEFIANTISMTPIKLYQETKDGVEEVVIDRRIRLLNDETGDTLDAVQFWKAMLTDYFLGKGGYAYIQKKGTKVESLHYAKEESVSVTVNADPIFKDYDILVNGKQYKPYDFIKLLRNTKDGASGTSIIVENEKILSVAYESLKFEEELVKKGGNKKGFLTSASQLTQTVLDGLKDAFRKLYSNNSENIVVLNKGIEFQESSNTSVEMQLNENKKTNGNEICKLFLLQESLIGGNSSGTSSEKEYNVAFKTAIMPIMRVIECALNRDFLLEKEKSQGSAMYWAFDTREILKGDMKARYDAYKIAIESGFKQIDEIRYMENDKPFGIDWINLGLNSVLYDVNTKEIFTPNTGKTDTMNKDTLETDKITTEGDELIEN